VRGDLGGNPSVDPLGRFLLVTAWVKEKGASVFLVHGDLELTFGNYPLDIWCNSACVRRASKRSELKRTERKCER
jgi:hypothetical protein